MSKFQDSNKNNYILLVDDNPDNLRLLSRMLEAAGYKVRKTISGKMAIQSAQIEPPNLILLDITMPEMDGYEVCQVLKSHAKTARIPIIFISALNETGDKVKAFEHGGVDYIIKPFEEAEVLARITNQLLIHKQQKQLLAQNQQLELEIRERQQVEAELQKSEASMRALYEVAANSNLNFEQRIHHLLVMGCQAFEMDFAVLSQIDSDRYEVIVAKSPDNSLSPGDSFNPRETFCFETLTSDEPLSIEHTSASSWQNHPAYKAFGMECYIGTRIRVAGQIYGSLCFCSLLPRDKLFKSADKELLKLMAQWAGGEIERQQSQIAMELQYQRALLLKQMTQDIRQTLDVKQIFQTAAIQIGNYFGVNRCLIHNYIAEPIQSLKEMIGDDDLLAELLKNYLEDSQQRVQKIRDAIASEDAATLHSSAHSLRSLSGSVGAMQLATLCQKLEAIGRDGTTVGTSALGLQLKAEYERVKASLSVTSDQ